jgi:WD40 repeat protein
MGPLPHPDAVTAVAFRRDGQEFATGCGDGHVRLWTLPASRANRSFAFDGVLRATAFSCDGRYLVVGGNRPLPQSTLSFHEGRFVRSAFRPSLAEVWIVDLAAGTSHEVLSEENELLGSSILALTSGPPGISTLLAAVHWSRNTSSDDSLHGVACSPNSPTAVTTGRDGFARLWDLTTGRPIGPPLPIGGAGDTRALFSPDGRTFLTCCNNGPVRAWETASGKPLFSGLEGGGRASVALFSRDGRRIATAGRSGEIAWWDATTGRLRTRFPSAGGEIRSLALSHDGRTLLAGCDGYALRLDASTGEQLGPRLQPRGEFVWEAEFSGDDTRFLTLAGDPYRKKGLLQVWDAAGGRLLGPARQDRLVLPAALFDPSGRFIATGDWEGKARLWDAQSATPVGPALGAPGAVQALAFSPDGRTLAVGAHDGTLTLWPIPTAMEGTAEQIQVWLEWATGQELDESGVTHELGPHDRGLRREALRKIGDPR